MSLSSRRLAVGWGDGVAATVAQQRPDDIDPPAGKRDQRPGVAFPLGAFALVERPGRRAAQAGQRRQVARPLQAPVVAAGPMQVAGASARVVGPGRTASSATRPAPRRSWRSCWRTGTCAPTPWCRPWTRWLPPASSIPPWCWSRPVGSPTASQTPARSRSGPCTATTGQHPPLMATTTSLRDDDSALPPSLDREIGPDRIKSLTIDNWRSVDPMSVLSVELDTATGRPRPITPEQWAESFLRPQLDPIVPAIAARLQPCSTRKNTLY